MDYVVMGKRIRIFRKQQGLTQATLAKKVGISTSFMGHIERGSRVASLETLLSLSDVLNVSLDVLVTGAGPEPINNPANNASVNYKMRLLNDVLRVLDEHSEEWLRDSK